MKYFQWVKMANSSFRVFAFLFFFCFSSLKIVAQSHDIIAQNNHKAGELSWEEALSKNVEKANLLWSQKKSDLRLAATILESATAHNAKQYFGLASHFYLWSLKNVDSNYKFSILKSEAHKIIPLLSREEQKRWESYIENKNQSLANALYGFWIKNDPYVTTKINERLIEHWSRIAYARKHFTKSDNTPYGTDDRGTIYVRLGPPDRKLEKRIFVTQVADPIGSGLYKFQIGNDLDGEIELWEYVNSDGENYFFIFGNRNGNGEFGLQKSVLDAFEFNDIRLQTEASLAMTNSVWRRFSKSLAKYALFEKLSAYHTHFENIYLEILSRYTSNPRTNPSLASSMAEFNSAVRGIGSLDYFETTSQIAKAPFVSTPLNSENKNFKTIYDIYRFMDNEGQEENVFAINSKIDSSFYKSSNDLLINHSVFIYDENWNLLNKLGSTQESTKEKQSYTSVYSLNKVIRQANMFYSSELTAPISNTPPIILSATGKHTLEVTEPLPETTGLIISDLIIGENQKVETNERIPIIPSLDYSFEKGTDIIIFFEAYNVPEGGYSFEYHFIKNRWLFGNKRVDEKPAVTIINDKAKERSRQVFSISLSDLEVGTYDLIFTFKRYDQPDTKIETKRVELKITDE